MKDINRNIAYIGFGSNLNDRFEYIKSAAREINRNENCKIIRFSSIYETKAYGETEQPNFLNAVAKTKTSLSVQELFRFIKNIEKRLGRKKTYKWGPREIDLDLLVHGEAVVHERDLEVPHPRLHERRFVLEPLAELNGSWIHPVLIFAE